MSHRTQDLPPLHGFARLLRELRYHEASRQFLAITFIVLFTSTSQPTLLLFAVSVPLVLAGVVLRLSASGHILKNEELTTTGPYSLVRHPLYSGNIMIILGFSISCGNWWAAPLALVFFYFYYPTAMNTRTESYANFLVLHGSAGSRMYHHLYQGLRILVQSAPESGRLSKASGKMENP